MTFAVNVTMNVSRAIMIQFVEVARTTKHESVKLGRVICV